MAQDLLGIIQDQALKQEIVDSRRDAAGAAKLECGNLEDHECQEYTTELLYVDTLSRVTFHFS